MLHQCVRYDEVERLVVNLQRGRISLDQFRVSVGWQISSHREGTFVDLYGPRLWLLILWVALMNVGDSHFTLVHLQAGGIELNPVADFLLGTGRATFVLVKSVLIALALIVLSVHKNFFLARIGLWTAAGTYTALVGYHLLLFRVT